MSIFKVKIIKIARDSEERWRMKSVHSGRVEKICEACKEKINIGDPSTAFSRKMVRGDSVVWITHHAHTGSCTGALQIKLKAILSKIS
jgi:hypothetical protein